LLGSGYQGKFTAGLAKDILTSGNNVLHQLAQLSEDHLNKIGNAKAIKIISALELGRRRDEFKLK